MRELLETRIENLDTNLPHFVTQIKKQNEKHQTYEHSHKLKDLLEGIGRNEDPRKIIITISLAAKFNKIFETLSHIRRIFLTYPKYPCAFSSIWFCQERSIKTTVFKSSRFKPGHSLRRSRM